MKLSALSTRAPLLALLTAGLALLTLAGCQKPDADLYWIDQQICQRPAPLNPYLILDNPALSYSSEQFARRDWPVSPEATKYATSYEYASYRNINFDRQSISPSGVPSIRPALTAVATPGGNIGDKKFVSL